MSNHVAAGTRVWVRTRRVPLTPEQSARLTAFASSHEGKPFALAGGLSFMTPFSRRGVLRTPFVGKVRGDRPRYFCTLRRHLPPFGRRGRPRSSRSFAPIGTTAPVGSIHGSLIQIHATETTKVIPGRTRRQSVPRRREQASTACRHGDRPRSGCLASLHGPMGRSAMKARRHVGVAMMGTGWLVGTLIGVAGCDAGAPPTGSRAIVAADHLEKQQARIEQIRASMTPRPSTKSFVRR
jgi:hypothetical protein